MSIISYHHRIGQGALSGNERYNMVVERLEFEFSEQYVYFKLLILNSNMSSWGHKVFGTEFFNDI